MHVVVIYTALTIGQLAIIGVLALIMWRFGQHPSTDR
jgi:hypothetical protein